MSIFLSIAILLITIYLIYKYWEKSRWNSPEHPFPKKWRLILAQKVPFYTSLSVDEKKHFEYMVQEFLLNCKITGVNTSVELSDKILVAASAIIPIFSFKDWRYTNLDEVLIYPGMFNSKFDTSAPDRNILGMVGTGYMEGKMILSKKALQQGFIIENDKKNTAIHEFVHLIDKMDGATDGIPQLLLEKQYTIPWFDFINKKIEEISQNKSDINPYGGTNQQEFFAVASEYFFERPKLLKQKHPKLYQYLEEIFKQKMASKIEKRTKFSMERNSPCPCGSGQKFKRCCGK